MDLQCPDLKTILKAAENISNKAIRTPLVKLNLEHSDDFPNVYLKLENLQPIGSFKVRPAANVLASVDVDRLKKNGVCTASAGDYIIYRPIHNFDTCIIF